MTVGRIPVIEGGIQPTIFDAKADLLTATAADTPARLAVGANFGWLRADSAQSTGLAWDDGSWTSYTPTVGAASGSITSYTVIARYKRIGKLCAVSFGVVLTNAGTGGGAMNLTLPFTPANPGAVSWVGAGRENALTGLILQCVVYEANPNIYVYKSDNSSIIATGHNPRGTVVFEVE